MGDDRSGIQVDRVDKVGHLDRGLLGRALRDADLHRAGRLNLVDHLHQNAGLGPRVHDEIDADR